jgi:hypothetical protein
VEYIGAGKVNAVLVPGNNSGLAETDSLTSDGQGDVIFTRAAGPGLASFNLTTTGIQQWYLEPSTGMNNVTIGDLTGTATKKVEVVASDSTIDAGGQNNPNVRLAVDGTHDTVTDGAGPTTHENTSAPTAASIIANWQATQV